MRREDHGVLSREVFNQLARLDNLFRVKPGRGFVEHQHFGVVDERLRQTHALAIAF